MDRSLKKQLEEALSLFDELGADTRFRLAEPQKVEVPTEEATPLQAMPEFAAPAAEIPTSASVHQRQPAAPIAPSKKEYEPALRDRGVLEALMALHQNRLPTRRAQPTPKTEPLETKKSPLSSPVLSDSPSLSEMKIPTLQVEPKSLRRTRGAPGLASILRTKPSSSPNRDH
jgi:hypothetical protein